MQITNDCWKIINISAITPVQSKSKQLKFIIATTLSCKDNFIYRDSLPFDTYLFFCLFSSSCRSLALLFSSTIPRGMAVMDHQINLGIWNGRVSLTLGFGSCSRISASPASNPDFFECFFPLLFSICSWNKLIITNIINKTTELANCLLLLPAYIKHNIQMIRLI